ncbi:YadA-like family protein, partial [Actinobacillus porcinus]|uniref:YadA-like family protein n=1 Tax=Actinobacillus porcinus TaxID=51048 RepID=UPI002A91B828
VANAINNSGFKLKTSATTGGEKDANSSADEMINPGDIVEMVAGKNLTVKQEADGKITYATKDEVNFKSVEVGNAEPTYKDKDGNELVKVGDNFYKKDAYDNAPEKADGTKNLDNVPTATVDREKSDTVPVKLTSDKGVATKETTLGADGKTETTTAKDAPSALNVKDSLGENSQINGIASALDTKEEATKPTGKEGAAGKDTLVDLTYPTLPENATDEEKEAYKAAKAKWESSAVTVGDIANMGWIVSASGNEYTDTVKNANKVEFKGENGISVTGKTTADGVREITVSLEKGEVIGANEGTVKIDGKDTDVVKVGDEYFKKEDIDPTTGKPKEGTTALGNDVVGNNGENVVNNGNKLVDGHTVAKAIQESGFTVGKETDTSGVDFNNKDEKVNPNDELRFADGKGTTVSTGTVKTIDPNGEVSTKTVVKVDIDQGDMDVDGGKLIDKILDDAEKAVEEKQEIVKELAANPDNINDLIKAANDLKAAQDALAKLEEALDPDTAAAREKVTAAENALKQLSKEENPNVNDLIKAAKDVEDARNELTKAKDAAPNKVATVADVVEAVNRTGFTLKTSANGGTKISGDDELINPADTIDMAAGKNLTVKQDANGKVTYATAENVNFTSVQFGDNGPKISADGNNNIKVGDKDGKPVKITNVKDGDITKDSTDAVNGSQIYALTGGAVTNVADVEVTNPKTGEKKVIKDVIVDKDGKPALVTYNVDGQGEYITNSVITAVNNMNKQGIKYFHTNDSVNRKEEMDQQWNEDDSRASGSFSTAIGYQAHAQGDNAVAFGNNAVAGEQGVAIGHGAVASGKQAISIGTGNKVTGNHSGAIGDPSVIDADNSYSMGNNNVIAQGQTDVFALGNNVKNTTSNSVFLGSNSGYVAASETTAGAGALESQVTGGVFNAYAGGKASEVKGVVSVGNVNSDGTMETRRIQNVAPGLISEKSTDAINGSQLYSLVANQNAQIGDIYNKMDREHKGLRAGIAGAAALAGIPEVHVAGRSMIAAAASAYKSENAVAVGYSRLSDNSKIKLKLTGSANTRGDVMGTVGVGYMW